MIMMRAVIFICICVIMGACGCSTKDVRPELEAILRPQAVENPYDKHLPSAPDEGCVKLRSKNIGPLFKAFADMPEAHLPHARTGGIKPIVTDDDAWLNGENLVRVVSDENMFVDTLHHSYPYLRPHANDLLKEIGKRFSDSLAARGGGAYRLKVTSLLRTPRTVKALRRVNRNASEESAHSYATTFDISYSKFICDDAGQTHRTFEDLKNLLAEIVYDLRAEGRCKVKIERRQACMHITACKPSSIDYPYVIP